MKHLAPALLLSCSICVLGQGCGTPKSRSGFANDTEVDRGGADAASRPGSSDLDGGGAGPILGGGDGLGSPLDAGCATATAKTSRTPVYMLIVLDGSGSMEQENKWNAVVPALDAIFDDFLAKNDPAVGVGLIAFSDSHDASCTNSVCKGPYPSISDVGIAVVDQAQHDKLRARIDTTTPTSGTPSYAALSGGYQSLGAFAASGSLAPDGKKVLVFMSDGLPSGGAPEQVQCTNAASAAFMMTPPNGPIRTFAVGIGQFPGGSVYGYDPAFMASLAIAGGTPAMGCNPGEKVDATKLCHFQVTPNGKPTAQITKEFVDAINEIRGAAAACEFVLERPDGGGQVDPSTVNVVYIDGDGMEHVLVQDPVNGWTYDDPMNPTRVLIHGVDCSKVQADPKGAISIVLGCATITK